jgi:hypothetical protein
MSKYIVEIERVPSLEDYSVDLRPDTVSGEHTMFRISGIDHLVFDKSCMKSFEPAESLIDSTHHSSYEQGYRDGVERGKELGRLESTAKTYEEALHDGRKIGRGEIWDAIKMLLTRDANQEYNHEFGGLTTPEIMSKYSIGQFLEMLNRGKDGSWLRVGDEVELAGKKVLVTRIPENDPQRIHYIDASGRTYANNSYDDFKKTGRHFPIEDLLGQMEVEA